MKNLHKAKFDLLDPDPGSDLNTDGSGSKTLIVPDTIKDESDPYMLLPFCLLYTVPVFTFTGERGHEPNPTSDRLQLLHPFDRWSGQDLANMRILIKVRHPFPHRLTFLLSFRVFSNVFFPHRYPSSFPGSFPFLSSFFSPFSFHPFRHLSSSFSTSLVSNFLFFYLFYLFFFSFCSHGSYFCSCHCIPDDYNQELAMPSPYRYLSFPRAFLTHPCHVFSS